MEIEVQELELEPIDPSKMPEKKIYKGEIPELNSEKWCDCDEYYDNQICVVNPRRPHSFIVFCPKCGCVTQD